MKCIVALPAFLLLSSGLLIVTPSSAQKFVPGYVLLNNGDTLRGLIQTEAWRTAPLLLRFKTGPNEEVHTYSPLLIRSFRIKGGEWYFSFIGDIDPSSLLDDNLDYDPNPDTLRVAMFIRAVVISKVSLYYARDQNDRIHLFIQKDGGAINELKYKKYYLDEKVYADYRNTVTRRAIMGNQIYKQQLIDAFADCKPLVTRLLDRPLAYAKNDIMGVVVEYNNFMDKRIVYKEEKERWKFEFYGNAGINYAGINFKSDDSSLDSVVFDNTLGFAVGIAMNILIPRTHDQWSIYNELFIRNFKTEGSSIAAQVSGVKDLSLDFAYVKLANMARYQAPKGEVRPFFNLGITNGVALKDDNSAILPSGETTTFLQFVRTYEQGLLLGGGVTWKSFSIDLRAEFSNGMSGYSNVKSSISTLYALAGYKF